MQNRFNFVDSVLLIAWPEIKHRSLAKLPKSTSTEILASFPGFVEDDFVRGGHMERFDRMEKREFMRGRVDIRPGQAKRKASGLSEKQKAWAPYPNVQALVQNECRLNNYFLRFQV